MMSTSLFPTSAEPPGGIQIALHTPVITRLLVAVGRQRRRRKWARQFTAHPKAASFGTSFAYADPPHALDLRTINDAIPERDPRIASSEFQEFDLDMPTEIRRAQLWTLLIAEAINKAVKEKAVRGVEEIACGFVRDAKGSTSLAAIFYVRTAALAQAAPLHIIVDEESFPVVLRPPAREILMNGLLGFPRGMSTAGARLGHTTGTLTAAHVVAKDGKSDGVSEGEKITCLTCPNCVEHSVVKASAIMDAVLIETGASTGDERTVRATPVAGYFPVEMRDPQGNLTSGWVTEIPLPEGVIPGTPGSPPTSPAMLMLSFAGDHGWSGGLVRETLYRDSYGGFAEPKPYGMFLGVRQLRTSLVGRMNMLAQLEQVWKIDLLEE